MWKDAQEERTAETPLGAGNYRSEIVLGRKKKNAFKRENITSSAFFVILQNTIIVHQSRKFKRCSKILGGLFTFVTKLIHARNM